MTPASSSQTPTAEFPAPRIVSRDAHNISRKQISPSALRVLYKLNEAGFDAYLVGGAVRDLLVDGHPKDFDVATNATPEQVKALFRNCRLIGRRFRLAHVIFGPEVIEVATFRANSDDGSGDRELHEGGRVLRDNVYGTIEDDAIRRDFTVNALYYGVRDFAVLDYVGGWEDVQHRTLRLIGDPEKRYREDPVRMLRGVRLAAKLGFSIEAATAAPIARLAPLLAEAPPARLFDEMLKLFLAGHGEAGFDGLDRHGLLAAVLPETAAALEDDVDGRQRAMLRQALANTDARVREGKTVTPAFLFAALLWPAFRRELWRLADQGLDPLASQQRAADRVTLHQAHRIAMPRRFSIPMQEIWLLQARFDIRQRKRVFRLLAHPRFRAAYDFLVLRLVEQPELAEPIAFWTEAQTLSHDGLAERLAHAPRVDVASAASAATDEVATPKKRPRRRRRRPGPAGDAAMPDTAT
ncbi:MAG TPA: polynucleotide adenylyltransferase PcnB [Xanthomonadaceae bacterium]|jgi:poly(A) polymerase|nr:polynucleotide adenylyltransferase PcnB [Xanthomonadaceae bacterium]